MSSKSKNGDDEWNEAWETAWLPEDMKGKNRAPWEADVNFPSSPSPSLDSDSKLALEPENIKKDYRLRKQRVHAGLWVKEIEKMEESKLGDFGAGDDIEKLLDSCSEIFDSPSSDLSYAKVPTTSEFKNNLMREEDILLQEYERRIAYSKFQIASFIKTHIFSRRRPIDGWKYMIEEIGPNAKKGKGSAPRIPTLSDPSTQPFREERPLMDNRRSPPRQR
ncbi:unnamed protein product [Rhodiola kirilowii]